MGDAKAQCVSLPWALALAAVAMLLLGYLGLILWLWWIWSRTPAAVRESVPRPRKAAVVWTIAAAGLAWLAGVALTVVQLIRAFDSVASVDASLRAQQLARGISDAMNWTAFGFCALAVGGIAAIVAGVRLIRAASSS